MKFLFKKIRKSDLNELFRPKNALEFTDLRQGLSNISYHAKKTRLRTNFSI